MTGAWLLEFRAGGRTHRYATRPVTVTSTLLGDLVFLGGLAPLVVRVDGLNEEQGVEVVDRGQDWPRTIARGHGIDREPATLRYWRDGDALEQARVVVDGVVVSPEYGGPGEPGRLVFTVGAPRLAEPVFPDAQASVSDATFTNTADVLVYDDAIIGAVYPHVLGYPGYRGADGDPVPAVPALLVHYNGLVGVGSGGSHLLVCSGRADALVQGGTVRLWDSDETNGLILDFAFQDEDAQEFSDLLGRMYTGIEFTTANPINALAGHHYYTSWSPDSGKGGGITLPDKAGPIRKLTDVLLWALRNSGRKVDLEAQEAERDRLDVYLVDGYLNDRVQLVPWVEAQLAPLFQLVRRNGPRGIWYTAIDWGVQRTAAIAHLDASSGAVRRATSVKLVANQVANLFTLDYQFSPQTSGYYGRRVLGSTAGELGLEGPSNIASPEPDSRVLGAPLCARSAARYGVVERAPVTTQFVWDSGTSSRIVQQWALRDCLPRRFVSYTGPDLDRFHRGDIVTITDDELVLEDAVALVDAVVIGSGRLHQIDLEILDQAFRSAA